MRRFLLFALGAMLLAMLPIVALAQVSGGAGSQTSGGLPAIDPTLNLILVASIMPPIIAIITRTSWTAELKQLASLFVCLIAAAGSAYLAGQLNLANLSTSAVTIVLISEALYQKFYKPLGITDAIETHVNTDPPPLPMPAPAVRT